MALSPRANWRVISQFSNLNKSARHAATHLLWSLRIQDNLLQAVADIPVTFRSRWLALRVLLRSSKSPPQKDESEHFGDFSYERQIEGLFVAFVIKIPNAFTDFDLWAGKRKATPSPRVPITRPKFHSAFLSMARRQSVANRSTPCHLGLSARSG